MASTPIISNTLTPQKGLVSTNPFLSGTSGANLNTGGTTTPKVGGSTGQTVLGVPYSSGTTTPVTSNINIAGTGGVTTGKPATVPSSNQTTSSGLVSPANSSLSAIPGETYDQYESRVNATTQPTTPTNNGSGVSGGTNPYTATAPTFNGLVGGLAGTASQPTQNFIQDQNTAQSAAQGLINAIPSQNQNVQTATTNLQGLEDNYANQQGIIGNSPIGLSEQGGEQGLLNNQYASKLANAQGALTNALTANQQEQSAYTGAGSLANTAGGVATGQQGTQQSGLAAAAGLAAPQNANQFGTYNPTTGEYEQYGGGSGGGASTAGAVGTQVQQGAQVQQMTGQQAQAQALAQNLNSVIESAGINPATPGNAGPMTAYVNGANQWLQNNTGDPQYQNFANLISEISSRYASILNQSGGTPTDQSALSHTIINSLAGGQSIQQVLQSLDKNATDSINALKGASQNNSAIATQSNGTASQYNW